jgi:HSP20 family molecular chaperone IbpA
MPIYHRGSPYPTGFTYPLGELRDDIDRLWTSLTTAPPLHGWGMQPGAGGPPGMNGFPPVNIAESDDCFMIEAELPGLDAADVEIAVTGVDLVLKGARPEPDRAEPGAESEPPRVEEGVEADMPPGDVSPGNGEGQPRGNGEGQQRRGNGEGQRGVIWHRRERGTGSFERRISLPAAFDASRVEAQLVDGVLTVTCPKAPEAQPRKIEVRSN